MRVVLLLLAGCYAPRIREGAPCPDGVCPSGQFCAAGVCTSSRSDDAGVDVGVDAPPAWTVTRLDALSTPSDDQDPTMTGDLLEIVWSTNRPGGLGDYDLWHATREHASAPWSTPVPLANLNTTSIEQSPELSRDGLVLYFSSHRDNGYDIWTSTRASRTADFAMPVKVDVLSSSASEANLGVTGNVAILDRGPPLGQRDLYVSTRAWASAPWSEPQPIAEVNSMITEGSPFLTDDLCTLWFHRSLPYRIYVARRAVPDAAWSEPEPLLDVGDSDPWLSPGSDTLLFGRDGDLYGAVR